MSRKLLVGTVALAGGILAVVFGWPSPPAVYAHSVSEFLAHPILDRPVRLEGTLVPGSVCFRSEPCEYRFRLAGRSFAHSDAGPSVATPELAVRYRSCVITDNFRQLRGIDTTVTLEGQQCARCHHFEASQVLVKCPAVYRANARERCEAMQVASLNECKDP